MHHQAPVADFVNHVEVVGDKQIRNAQLPAQPGDQLQDLGLDGHVQGRHGLVGHDQLGVHDQRRADAHPLPLSAGQLMGQPVPALRVQAHQLHGPLHPPPDLLPVILAVYPQGLGQNPAHGAAGVQAAGRVLEHHLGPLGEVGHRAGIVRHKAQNGPGQGGLSAAGLPHQAQNLPPVQVKAHIMEHLPALSAPDGPGGPVPYVQVTDLQNKVLAHSFLLVGMAAISRWV